LCPCSHTVTVGFSSLGAQDYPARRPGGHGAPSPQPGPSGVLSSPPRGHGALGTGTEGTPPPRHPRLVGQDMAQRSPVSSHRGKHSSLCVFAILLGVSRANCYFSAFRVSQEQPGTAPQGPGRDSSGSTRTRYGSRRRPPGPRDGLQYGGHGPPRGTRGSAAGSRGPAARTRTDGHLSRAAGWARRGPASWTSQVTI